MGHHRVEESLERIRQWASGRTDRGQDSGIEHSSTQPISEVREEKVISPALGPRTKRHLRGERRQIIDVHGQIGSRPLLGCGATFDAFDVPPLLAHNVLDIPVADVWRENKTQPQTLGSVFQDLDVWI
jgi:hypothetical protein